MVTCDGAYPSGPALYLGHSMFMHRFLGMRTMAPLQYLSLSMVSTVRRTLVGYFSARPSFQSQPFKLMLELCRNSDTNLVCVRFTQSAIARVSVQLASQLVAKLRREVGSAPGGMGVVAAYRAIGSRSIVTV